MCREGAGSVAAYGGLPVFYRESFFFRRGGGSFRRRWERMYQALYRKWRPKTFADVTGQSHITETLQKQVAEDRTSHA